MPRSSKVSQRKAATATRPRKSNSKPTMAQRQSMIAEAAYFKAEHRNFTPGFEENDWLEAEEEIKSRLSNP